MENEDRKISMSFDSSPFGVAMSAISSETGAAIVWGKDADETYISGTYVEANLYDLLLSISKRYGFQLSRIGDIYFVGQGSPSDLVSCVVRSPSSEQGVKESIASCVSEFGKVSQVGSCLIVSDYMVNVRKVVDVCEQIKKQNARGYVCELVFMRMKNDDYLQLQANLQMTAVDLFSSFKVEDIFSAYCDLSARSSRVRIVSRPILFLSEGRQGILEVGSEITRTERSVSSEGYSMVSGYRAFNDGVSVSLMPFRVSTDVVSLDVLLTVASFEDQQEAGESVPVSNKSTLNAPGVLMRLGEFQFLGSLFSEEKKRNFALVGGSGGSVGEVLTVWAKISETKL